MGMVTKMDISRLLIKLDINPSYKKYHTFSQINNTSIANLNQMSVPH